MKRNWDIRAGNDKAMEQAGALSRDAMDQMQESAPWFASNGMEIPGRGVGYEWGQYGEGGDNFMKWLAAKNAQRKAMQARLAEIGGL